LRLKTLLDKKRVIQARIQANSKVSANLVTLVEGFQQFDNDLNKLQQFVEVNETAISKILKKWDKTSKSRTKELYLHRAVEIQPCFNRDVLRDLSDKATTARLDLEALSEGDNIQHIEITKPTIGQRVGTEASDTDLQVRQAAASGNLPALKEWLARLSNSPNPGEVFTRIFLASISDAPNDSLLMILESPYVNIQAEDDINERNCLHEATIYGKDSVLEYALAKGVDPARLDSYGRLPLHYACLKGRLSMLEKLLAAAPDTVDVKDHDNFTPLIHSIVHEKIECVRTLLSHNASAEPSSSSDHIPLNLACQHESIEAVTLLLKRHAEFLPDAEGLFPQHLVARSSRTADLLLLLKDHGADLNQRDKLYQWTPLFHAASEGRVECLRVLLEHGADPTTLDEKGLTATYYATWEGHLSCMHLLWEHQKQNTSYREDRATTGQLAPNLQSSSTTAMEMTPPELGGEADGIPDLSLPPPIMPMRRYGHNFLDTKCFVSINFERGAKAIQFFNEARYPASRITISSKISDIIPRNIMLPIQEDSRAVLFQVDNLATFNVDFEIFPTFGSKVIAKSVALPDVWQAVESSSGTCCLPLFDPRLRAVGQIHFNFQVIKPYNGQPLEITQFATYWKATSALDESGLITGSSLSGDYLRLHVQLTRDAIPVIYPTDTISHAGLDVHIGSLSSSSLAALVSPTQPFPTRPEPTITSYRDRLANSLYPLKQILAFLPPHINLNLHILYPSRVRDSENTHHDKTPTSSIDINTFADAILTDVFEHARALRAQAPDLNRSVVFTSNNSHICSALNWKQPNFPVLLVNELGSQHQHHLQGHSDSGSGIQSGSAASTATSIKESVRLAQSNNFMGVSCKAHILSMVPALVHTIKHAGLVLVSDSGNGGEDELDATTSAAAAGREKGWAPMPEGVNGLMKPNGVLRFNESVDM
jgi:CDK inhibitor PHO81